MRPRRLLALALLTTTVSARAEERTIRLRYTPEDAMTGRYQYVPFDVPEGTTRIDIAYRYDKADGAHAIDLGLFDGSLELGTRGLRGYSGGARDEAFVALDAATPGYWPGPIPAGRWHVLLGLYKVGPAGVDAVVVVKTSRSAVAGTANGLPPRSSDPLRKGAAWYSGGLHAHTVHSDGRLTTPELAAAARADGLDFLVITDHNNTAQQVDRVDVPDLLTISGEEVTTPGGHLNVWGLRGPRAFVDFRVLPGDPRIQDLVNAAHAAGGLASINHPYADCFACAWTHPVPEEVDAIEIANRDAQTLAQGLAMWDVLLRQGKRVTAVGASDYHRTGENPIGSASVRVWAEELGTQAILDGLSAGRVVVMADGRTPPPFLRLRAAGRVASPGDTVSLKPAERMDIEVATPAPAYAGGRVDLVWRGELVASAKLGDRPAHFTRWATADGYLRAHVHSASGAPLAITNPIFVKIAQ